MRVRSGVRQGGFADAGVVGSGRLVAVCLRLPGFDAGIVTAKRAAAAREASGMATIHPKDIFEPCAFGTARLPFTHHQELVTLRLLRDALPDHYTVFHATHVSWWDGKKSPLAEADFVVVNRDGDALMIEQKNGRLDETERGLVKTYDDADRNVISQMHRCADALRDSFKQIHGDTLTLRMILYCPDHTLTSINAVGLPRELVVDRPRAGGLVSVITKLLGPGGGGATAQRHQRVIEFLRNTYQLTVTTDQLMELHGVSADRLTGGLLDALRRFEMHPLRLRIAGTAGCGKTEIARDTVQRWAGAGRRTLLVCFNNALAAHLAERFGDAARVATVLGLCRDFMHSRGVDIDFTRASTPGFWRDFLDRMQALVLTEPPRGEWLFDGLIVDEGQDFEPDQFEVMTFFLREGGDIVWLEDREQNLYGKPPFPASGFATFRADGNFRTPLRIARFVQRALAMPFRPLNPVPGEGVHVHAYGTAAQQLDLIGELVTRLLKRGFNPEQIVVLSARGLQNAVFRDADRLGPLAVRRFAGYDAAGHPTFTDGALLCDTVWRFKGLEAPVVLLTDVDPAHDGTAADPRLGDIARRVLYCGMTRATWRLELLVAKGNPARPAFQKLASGV